MSSLEGMQISLDGIGHALSDNRLVVPRYQRSYAWEDKHVTELFQDLASSIDQVGKDQEYFLGSIVIAQNEVVDGQQRLATTMILLAAIRDFLVSLGDLNRAQDIDRDYLMTRDLRSQERIAKLRLNDVDHDFFRKRVLAYPNEADRKIKASRESHKRIDRAADLARRHIESVAQVTNRPIERLLDWVDYINSMAKVIWVRVPEYTNAFTIFETLNDRGLDLAVSDLLKNYLFNLAGDRIEEVQSRWVSMVGALEAVDSEDLIVTYIRHLWSSQFGLTRERDLYGRIKGQIVSKQQAVDFADELAVSSRLYAAILNHTHEVWSDYGATASRHMETLSRLGMIQLRPLLLAILNKFTVQEVRSSLRFLVSSAVRFLIFGGLGGGTLESHYAQRAKEVQQGSIQTARQLVAAMQDVVPNDRAFLDAFATATVSKKNLARYYLNVLEQQARGEQQPELVPNTNEEMVTLEHILPQHPSGAWEYIDQEIVEAFYNRLGNLTLLQKRLNESVGNQGFDAKRQHYRSSAFQLTSALSDCDTWGTEEIETRQRQLAELAIAAWPNRI